VQDKQTVRRVNDALRPLIRDRRSVYVEGFPPVLQFFFAVTTLQYSTADALKMRVRFYGWHLRRAIWSVGASGSSFSDLWQSSALPACLARWCSKLMFFSIVGYGPLAPGSSLLTTSRV